MGINCVKYDGARTIELGLLIEMTANRDGMYDEDASVTTNILRSAG